MPYPDYQPDEPWIMRMSVEELRKNLAKTANAKNRERAKREKYESALIRISAGYRQIGRALNDEPEPEPYDHILDQ